MAGHLDGVVEGFEDRAAPVDDAGDQPLVPARAELGDIGLDQVDAARGRGTEAAATTPSGFFTVATLPTSSGSRKKVLVSNQRTSVWGLTPSAPINGRKMSCHLRRPSEKKSMPALLCTRTKAA